MLPDIFGALPYLRQQNMLGVPQTPDDDSQFISDRMAQLYHPSNTANEAYNSYLATAPNRADYEPGRMAKIGAVIAGMGAGAGPVGIAHGSPVGFHGNSGGAFNTTSGILNAPYDRAREDFDSNLKPLQFAASEETKNNQLSRGIAHDTVNAQLRERNIKRQEDRDKATNEARKKEDEIKAQRANSYQQAVEWRTNHPNYEGRIDKDGKLVYIDKNNPNKLIRTDIETGKLNDFEKIRLGVQGKLREIEAKGEQDRQTEGVKETNREKLEGQKVSGRKEVKATVPGKAGGNNPDKPLLPSQQKIDAFNKAIAARNSDPELSKYIQIAPGNNFQLVMPMFGDKAKFDKAHDLIYGKSSSNSAQPSGSGPNPSNLPQNVPHGKIRVTSPQGQSGTIDEKDWAYYEKQGFKKVGG